MANSCDTSECLSRKLQRLDVLLHREILRLRARYELSLDEFRGLYISDEHVDRLIDEHLEFEDKGLASEQLTQRADDLRKDEDSRIGENVVWRRLVDIFSLTTSEQDVLLLALAPEIDLKYETLYGYLNNDVTRKWPTHDLALRLFASNSGEKLRVRRELTSSSTLFRTGLLESIPSSAPHTSSLANGFSVAPVVLDYLLLGELDQQKPSRFASQHKPDLLTRSQNLAITQIVRLRRLNQSLPLILFTGREGSGRYAAAEAVCNELCITLVRVDLRELKNSSDGIAKSIQTVVLRQRLHNTVLYVDEADALFDEQGKLLADARQILKALSQSANRTFIACSPSSRWQDLLSGQRIVTFDFEDPDYVTRRELWRTTLKEHNELLNDEILSDLSARFALTGAQISCAVATAIDRKVLNSDSSEEPLALSTLLFDAARSQSDHSLGTLALKVPVVHTWNDLVLPRLTLERVMEVAFAIKNRHIVYSEWGFDDRISSGKGLKALFAGPSGTGKTMTASVIARELELELFKIDLSNIVSKYIGETEKNLDRIFRAATNSNAILFFDEADALFGKRSEVKDAHDRYANIEVAYLLQKIEDYEGVVILASNLSKNIDEAFSRRMHYVVEFPLPDEMHRERLWRNMFPPALPLGVDIDYKFLARKFSIAGGDIRNVALDAAFLAAQDGKVVTMWHLTRALARQMTKQGKIPSAVDFQQYDCLLRQGE